MSVSRRTFLRSSLAVGPLTMTTWLDVEGAQDPECTLPKPGTPVQLVPKEPRVVQRITAADLNDPSRAEQLKTFRGAVGALRALPATDPRSWTKQIAQHCISCDPNNQQNIHFDWFFVGWHRALLYFVEKILRTLGKSDDLRLPYWDWENKASRTLPAIYAPTDQPLYWKNRRLTGPSWPLSDDDTDVQPLLVIPTFRNFGGTAQQGRPTPAIFSGPHANVHNAFNPGDMADLQYSPRDPVFYAHHANIDRLWSSWAALPGHTNPNFGKARVLFYDEKSALRFVLLNDLTDTTRLGYQYSTLMKPTVVTKQLTSVPVKGTGKGFAPAPGAIAGVIKAKGAQHFLLIQNIQNLDKLPADTVRYGIFDGPVPAKTQSADHPQFLGKATRVLSQNHAHSGQLSASLNVTGKIQRALADENMDLRVIPLDDGGYTIGEGIPLAAEEISIIGG